MRMPDKKKPVHVPHLGITIEVFGYREPTDAEARQAAIFFLSNRKRGKVKKGSVIQMMTPIGGNE